MSLKNSFTSYFLSSMEIPVRYEYFVELHIKTWNVAHRYIRKSYVEEMILLPFLYHVNAGAGSPTASQSILPFPWRPISSFVGGGFESFHFGATMEANVLMHDFIIWLAH